MKRWLDPRTVSKITVVSTTDALRTLEASIDINRIPTQFGGKFRFEHGMEPKVEEAIMSSLSLTQSSMEYLPPGPIKLVHEGGKLGLVAVGTSNEQRREDLLGYISLPMEQGDAGNGDVAP